MQTTTRRDLPYWLGLVRARAFSPRHIVRLATQFASMQEAFSASVDQLTRAGIPKKPAGRFVTQRKSIDPLQEAERLAQHGIRAITIANPAYPPLLKRIYDPPPVLFVRGTFPVAGSEYLSVVGSRKASRYGRRMAEHLLKPVAAAGAVIVSGLAYGIDGCAHRATLDVNGRTVAVLASDLLPEHLTPTRHRSLAERILETGGALISEFPIGTQARPHYFPIRNRIIAGLSNATLVIEAAERSGSLVTAKSALDSNRDVLAVPGPATSTLSGGTNMLIKEGAGVVTTPEDLFQHLRCSPKPENENLGTPQDPDERRVFRAIGTNPTHIDEISAHADLPASQTAGILTILEMNQYIQSVGGRRYVRRGST